MEALHYLNGKWVDTADLKISAFDLSVVRGFGVFDFLRTYDNKPFLLDDHLDRLFSSAKLIGIKMPKSKSELAKIVFTGVKKNKFKETNIKIIVTGGKSADSITPGNPSLILMFLNYHDYPHKFYTRGIKVITVREGRSLHLAKSLNYLAAVISVQKAKQKGAEEALYINGKGKLYEATRSNFFAVIDGKLITVKQQVLHGVTRKVVIRLANKLQIPVIERDVFTGEIANFSEAFVTATNKEVMPVVQIDNKKIGKGRIGPITKKLMAEYSKLTRSDDPFF
ncbi:hypothetical protein A2774_05710 [Candidatus Roizmanbacteria bacterium RIFCSPHIGHO2_01_FULL_39_12c]|uniref:Amino acid aminotransferase n=1 Tax=Candidatus Roizmanbacteria bacterium RIFCSPHIGHO2_01_FULL_39_12c TaxID=1802031 RepID=A0A1F7G956_9BACT|nr:MAG: hypothetical protein A2774_05710 [Candidatus Roizmanbacteria bacterium RIFCSPHIGHO2_01_FULL_39_12c]